MSLRRALRAAMPEGVRVAVARVRRAARDSGLMGTRPRLATPREMAPAASFAHQVLEVVQEIKPSAHLEGKLVNIRLSAARLDGVVVAPGETLSFWALVGRPTEAAGFRIGRSIRDDIVGGEIGGGLCQVSGIAYEAGLRAGLTPVERHPHSRDLYTEAERFTPLGLDATVVWPWKDLRLVNGLAVPVRFRFVVRDLRITASVEAPVALAPATLEIVRTDHPGRRDVRVLRHAGDGEPELVSDDLYPAAPGG